MDIFSDKYKYEDRFVAFIDILGFKDIITAIEAELHDDNHKLHSTKSVLNFLLEETQESHYFTDLPVYEIRDGIAYEYELGHPRLTYISDCIIISTDGDLDGFKALSRKIHKIIADLAVDGFFCRGAITRGKIFHHGQILFGSAYINAYKLEAKAIYPRVIVDPAIIDFFDFSKIDVPLSPAFYSKDTDGLFYLNLTTWYLFPPYCGGFTTFLLIVREKIINNLNQTDMRTIKQSSAMSSQEIEKIFKKYEWLYQEFNRNIVKYMTFFGLDEVKEIQFSDSETIWK